MGVLDVWETFKQGYDHDKFMAGGVALANDVQGGRAEGDAEESKQAKLEIVEDALDSLQFLGSLIMFDIVSFIVLSLASWHDDCSCHGQPPGAIYEL